MKKIVSKHEKGVSSIEYGLVAALISIVIMGSVSLSGKRVYETFCDIGLSLQAGYGCVPSNITANALKPANVSALGGAGFWFSDVADLVNQINSTDSVTGIYGFFSGSANGSNNSSNNDITDTNKESFAPLRTVDELNDYIDRYKEDGTWDFWSVSSGFSGQQVMEVSTESGKAYTIYHTLTYPVPTNPYSIDNDTGERIDLK